MNNEWYIYINEKPEGIFSKEQIERFISSGNVTKGALVWKKGLVQWSPIELYFNFDDQNNSSDKVDLTLDNAKSITYKPQNLTLMFSLVLLSIMSIVGFILFQNSFKVIDDFYLILIWFIALSLSAVIATSTILILWKHSNFLWHNNKWHKIAGLLRISCFFFSICLILYIGIFTNIGLTKKRILKARSSFNKYDIDVDPALKVITISGLIGPNLAKNVIDKLSVHSDINTILIDSPGGLVDEGLSAAKHIQSLNSSTVIANGTCNSSCLLILMSGKHRLASWNMKFGFHAVNAITNLGEFGDAIIYDLGEENYAYLINRGVPNEIIEQVKATGPSKLVTFPAIDLYDKGVLTGLIDGKNLIDADNAKWKYIEKIIDDPELLNLSSVFTAIRESDQSLVKKYANSLYEDFKSNNIEKIKTQIVEITGSVRNRSLKAAEGSELISYIAVQYFQTRHLAKLEQWKACVEYLDGNMTKTTQAFLSKELREKEHETFSNLIRSASSNKWKSQPIPSWAKIKVDTISKEVLSNALEIGIIEKETEQITPKGQCIFYYMLLDKFLDLQQDTAAPALRSFFIK